MIRKAAKNEGGISEKVPGENNGILSNDHLFKRGNEKKIIYI
jgi:hypothetical protein